MRRKNNIRSDVVLLTLALMLFPTCSMGNQQTGHQKDSSGQAAGGLPSAKAGEGAGKEAQAAVDAGAGVSEEGGEATGQTSFGPNARACRLLPIADIENHFGAKVKLTEGV